MLPTTANKVQHFRKACFTCHTDKSCSTAFAERRKQNDSCIACHMPSGGSANIPHASVTDHRIPKKPGTSAIPKPSSNGLPFVLFHAESKYGPDADERERDLGMALAKSNVEGTKSDPRLISESISRLQTAVQKHPSDAAAWEMLSRMKGNRGQWKEADADIAKAITIAPRDEAMLQWAAECAFETSQHARSLEMARRAMAINPGNVENGTIVGNALMELGEYQKAFEAFQNVIEVVPSKANARVGLAICLSRLGDPQGGRKMLELAIEMDPERAKLFREWFLRKAK